jgi:ABC-type nitrate/sulfonate/bicarbonate transport system permease component
MISGGGGAGTALMYAQRFFDTPEVYAYIIIMLATGFLFETGLAALQRKLFPWETEATL